MTDPYSARLAEIEYSIACADRTPDYWRTQWGWSRDALKELYTIAREALADKARLEWKLSLAVDGDKLRVESLNRWEACAQKLEKERDLAKAELKNWERGNYGWYGDCQKARAEADALKRLVGVALYSVRDKKDYPCAIAQLEAALSHPSQARCENFYPDHLPKNGKCQRCGAPLAGDGAAKAECDSNVHCFGCASPLEPFCNSFGHCNRCKKPKRPAAEPPSPCPGHLVSGCAGLVVVVRCIQASACPSRKAPGGG